MKIKLFLAVITVLLLPALGYAAYMMYVAYHPKQALVVAQVPVMHTYNNPKYGFEFVYPDDYLLSETDTGTTTGKSHHVIMLVEKSETVTPANGETPPSITLSIYQNSVPLTSLADWFKKSPDSGSNLTDGTFKTANSDGDVPVIVYRTAGLYQGDTTAFEHAGYIVAVAVTYQSISDANIPAYRTMLSSFHLYDEVSP